MPQGKTQKRIGVLASAFFLVLAFAVSPASADEEKFTVRNVSGDAIVRPAGEYLWRSPSEGQEIDVGDRVRVRAGHAEILLPQGVVSMDGPGELEIQAEIADGVVGPWQDVVQFFIGEYSLSLQGARPLKILTLFAEIEGEQAELFLGQTQKGLLVKVVSGKVHVRHLRKTQLDREVVYSGQSLLIAPTGMRPATPSENLLALLN